jgi:hypothetical protein
MKNIIGLILGFSLILGSCEWLEENGTAGLTEEEIVEGLKTALEVGADSATTLLNAPNGYYNDLAVKILLPPEAEIIISNLNKLSSNIPGGEQFMNDQLDKLILSLNKAAEDAADDALPILTKAVTNLSIQDGWNILHGTTPVSTKSTDFDSLAATHYLEDQTKTDLIVAFSTPINTSLNKPLVGNTSTNDIWSTITLYYNNAVDIYNLLPLVSDLDNVNADLGEYATEKALDGLFVKVGDEEKKIRRNPFDYLLDILEKVFGSL